MSSLLRELTRQDWNRIYQKTTSWENYPCSVDTVVAGLVQSPARILDLGCGSGRNMRALANRGYHVYGVDLSEVALGKAKTYNPASQICVGKSELLPFKNGSFDVVLAYRMLNWCAISLTAFEISQALKPGGYVVADSEFPTTASFPQLTRDFLTYGINLHMVHSQQNRVNGDILMGEPDTIRWTFVAQKQ